ncbi:hypothetical protein MMC14_007678 [Varicellaria rhodocarpa]|nr:hypothetical protein [Varicellaria rhodocarpa]
MEIRSLHSVAIWLLFLVISATASASSASDASAITLIHNNINLYLVLIDAKNFSALDQVFTPDASPDGLAGTNSSFPNNLTGIELFLQAALNDVTTLHYSDTQYVEIGPSGDTATAISYA